MTERDYEAALAGVKQLERIEISLAGGRVWFRVFGDGRQLIVERARPEQLADVLQIAETLFAPELGRRPRLCIADQN